MAGKVSSDPNQFILPDLGEGLEEAELIKWVVSEGDEVEEHQILAEMETDKALVEVPSPRAGTIKTLHGNDGDVIKVGAVFVTYEGGPDDAPAATPAPAADKKPAKSEDREDAGTVVGQVSDSLAGMGSGDGKALAAPAVRRLARDLGIDIDSVQGTGIGGRVTAKDVRNASENGGATKPAPSAASQSAPSASSAPAPKPAQTPSRPAEVRKPLNLPSTNVGQSYAPQQPYAPQPSYQHYPQQQPGYGYAPQPAYPYPPQPYPAYPPYGYAPPPPLPSQGTPSTSR